jgi:cephalosporin hydroxylase
MPYGVDPVRFFRLAFRELLWWVVRHIAKDPHFFSTRVRMPIKKEYRDPFKMTLGQWLLYHQIDIIGLKCTWMGVCTLKNPCDAWIYQEIIYEVKPDVIVEIGSFEGGGTLYFANLLDLVGKGVVISIDNNRTVYNVKHERIIELTGDSSSPEIVNKVEDLCKGKTVLVIHDGDHSRRQVLKDMDAYSKLVTVNSYLIVEDGLVDIMKPGILNYAAFGSFKDGGPLRATEHFLMRNPNFVVDRERERYILTYNPEGFLKRIK